MIQFLSHQKKLLMPGSLLNYRSIVILIISLCTLSNMHAMENSENIHEEIKVLENDSQNLEMALLDSRQKTTSTPSKKRKKREARSWSKKIAGALTIGLLLGGAYVDTFTIQESVYTKSVIKAIPFNETVPQNTDICTYTLENNTSCDWAKEYPERVECIKQCQNYYSTHHCNHYVTVELGGERFKEAQCPCYILSTCNETLIHEPFYSTGITSLITRMGSLISVLIYGTTKCTSTKLHEIYTRCFKKKQETLE